MDYSQDFHQIVAKRALSSADVVLTTVFGVLGFTPRRVVDVGCGRGEWLQVAQAHGVSEVCGVDHRIPADTLLIPSHSYHDRDLHKLADYTLEDAPYDLALSLETAEHIRPEAAEEYVAFLTRCAPIILHSAAVPLQADIGIGHFNEQWPEYWQDAYAAHDYVMLDTVRPRISQDERVAWYYRQNMMLIMRRDLWLTDYSALPLYDPEYVLMHRETRMKYDKLREDAVRNM